MSPLGSPRAGVPAPLSTPRAGVPAPLSTPRAGFLLLWARQGQGFLNAQPMVEQTRTIKRERAIALWVALIVEGRTGRRGSHR
jgi:hypothetical protein